MGEMAGRRHRLLLILLAFASVWLPAAGMPSKEAEALERLPEGFGGMSGRAQRFLLSILKTQTQAGYVGALTDLKSDLDELGLSWRSMREQDRDYTLVEIFLDRMENKDTPHASVYTLAVLRKLNPGARFVAASAILSAWKANTPIRQAPACPEDLVFCLAILAAAAKQQGVAICFIACFFGLLRIGEAVALTIDTVLDTPNGIVLLLGRTKRGIDERVLIDAPEAVAAIRSYIQANAWDKGQAFLGISYGKFSYWLRKLSAALCITAFQLTSHSFRRGGASTLFHKGKSLVDIAAIGRWASERSMREYIRRGELFLLRFQNDSHPASHAALSFVRKFRERLPELLATNK
jgi:hypothetical protein